jgi:hypothetical protein
MKNALAIALVLLAPTVALAQAGQQPSAERQAQAREEAGRLLTEAEAHTEAGRPALAARSYLAMYEVMRSGGLPRAPIALYSAGRALAQVPGREQEARETLQRFLDESTTLTEDPQVRDWRSNALEQITELNARIGSQRPPGDDTGARAPQPSAGGGGVSPVGPVLLGIGGASLVAGVIIFAVAVAENDALVAMCPGGVCPTSARSRAEGVESLGLAADITLIGGAVVAATGLALTLLLRDAPGQDSPVAVGCGVTGCGVELRGHF